MEIKEVFKNVLDLEAKALQDCSSKLSEKDLNALDNLFERLLHHSARLVFCGVGKSGIVAEKAVATFNSLAQPSVKLHPVEALHGDLGAITENDYIVVISKSGTTDEILKLMPYLPMPKENRVALVGNINSPIANQCHVVLDASIEKEACINNQAPTTSTTVAIALTDAMSVFYEKKVGLSKENFALNHPAGFLGKSLRLKVDDLMIDQSECGQCSKSTSLKEVMLLMTSFNTGGCAIVGESQKLEGIIVEGDVRRTLSHSDTEKFNMETPAELVMTRSPVVIQSGSLAIDALKLMEDRESSLSILPVLKGKTFLGFITLHELLKQGLKNK